MVWLSLQHVENAMGRMVKTSIKHLKSRLKHLHAEPPPVSKHPVRFNGRKSSERRSINFSNYHLSLHWSHDQIVM